MPNFFAYAIMVAWPVVAIYLLRRLDRNVAVVCIMVVPYLLLPEKVNIDLPLLPAIGKDMLIGFTAFFVLRKHFKDQPFFGRDTAVKVFLIAGFLAPVLSVLTNREPLVFTDSMIPGMRLWDLITFMTHHFSIGYVPFIVGYYLLGEKKDHRALVVLMVWFGLFYALPALWEIRMSPRLHLEFYGIFPHDFKQQVRYGGFRPMVFLGHGLLVAAFFSLVVISALFVWKNEPKLRFKFISPLHAFVGMIVVLFLCKTVGALVITLGLVVIVLSFSKNLILRALLAIGLLLFLYPGIKTVATPVLDSLVEFAASYDQERAESLFFRFKNETMMLERAMEKSLFGWSGYGRNFVYTPEGNPASTPDGFWIIKFGAYGWLGYLSFFGLTLLGMLRLRKAPWITSDPKKYSYSIGLGVMLAANLIDLIPNSSSSPITLLLAGALCGVTNANTAIRSNPSINR